MIQIHKTTTQVLFIFHRPGARAAWVYDGQQFLRFVYLTATQEFRFVRRQAYLPAGWVGAAGRSATPHPRRSSRRPLRAELSNRARPAEWLGCIQYRTGKLQNMQQTDVR